MADAITVHCPSCETAFPVDPEKVPEGGVNARCSECEDIFRVDAPTRETGVATEVEGGGTDDLGVGEELPGFDVSEPEVEVEEEDEGLPELETEAAEFPEGEEEEETEDWTEEYFSTSGVDEEEFGEAAEAPTTDLPGLEEEPSSEAIEAEPPSGMEEPGIAGPELDIGAEEAPEVEGVETGPDVEPGLESADIEADAPGETLEEPPSPDTEGPEAEAEEMGAEPLGTEPVGVEEEEEPEEEPATESRRPAFGNRSPEEKAQRLARVLVSDMITYNPNMYETALARGTLKEDFAEEIEKSWEEYVEQVGEDLATSTSHWTDALNDILAKGEETF